MLLPLSVDGRGCAGGAAVEDLRKTCQRELAAEDLSIGASGFRGEAFGAELGLRVQRRGCMRCCRGVGRRPSLSG